MTTTVPEPTDTEQPEYPDAVALADGLRRLAAFVEANPEFGDDLMLSLGSINVPHIDANGDAREYLAKYIRATARFGAKVTKSFSDNYAGADLAFGAIALHVYAARADACERVVVGTREVTEEVPDPEALKAVPKVTVTKTVEDVEWRCHPLLDEAVSAR